MKKVPKGTLSIRIDAEMREHLEAAAHAMGLQPSDVARQCLSLGLPLVMEGAKYTRSLFARRIADLKVQ